MYTVVFACDECNKHCVDTCKQPRREPILTPYPICKYGRNQPRWKHIPLE